MYANINIFKDIYVYIYPDAFPALTRGAYGPSSGDGLRCQACVTPKIEICFHSRFIYEGDTSTHTQGTDPRVALGA